MAKQQQKYFIGPALLSDIRATITRVDAIAPKTSGAAQPVRLQELQRPAPNTLRRGTFTGSWAIDATNVVTIEGTTQTVQVTNYCVPVEADTAATQSFNVIFGSVMGTQTVVEIQQPTNTCTTVIGGVNLAELPGFDAGVIQLLGHGESDSNSTSCFSLQWFSVTACSTATAT